jgi:hypothetical protein
MTPIFVSCEFVLDSLQNCHVLSLHSLIGVGILQSDAPKRSRMPKGNLKYTINLTE